MAAKAHDVSSSVPPGEFVDSIRAGRVPTCDEFIRYLESMDPFHAVLLAAAGLVYMLWGWRMFKVLVTVNAALLGFGIGHCIGNLAETPHNLPVATGIAGALLLGVLALPLMKGAVSVMGALVGGVAGLMIWRYVAVAVGQDQLVNYAWAGGMLGLVTLGLSAFVIFRMQIMIFTSLQGSAMGASAVLALLLHYERFRPQVEDGLMDNIHLLPLIILVPTIIAVVIQDATGGGKAKKKPQGG